MIPPLLAGALIFFLYAMHKERRRYREYIAAREKFLQEIKRHEARYDG